MKSLLSIVALLSFFSLCAAMPYVGFGKGAKAQIKSQRLKKQQMVTMEMLPGNPYNGSGWFTYVYPMKKPGTRIKVTIHARAEKVQDFRGAINLSIQAADARGRYIAAKPFSVSEPAMAYQGKGGVLILEMVVPQSSKAKNWDKGKTLLITFGANASSGKYYFTDFTITDDEK